MLPDRFCCQWEFLHPITLQSFSGLRLLSLPSEKYSEAFSGAPSNQRGGAGAGGRNPQQGHEPMRQQEPTPPLPDIGAIINNALRAAGLIKS